MPPPPLPCRSVFFCVRAEKSSEQRNPKLGARGSNAGPQGFLPNNTRSSDGIRSRHLPELRIHLAVRRVGRRWGDRALRSLRTRLSCWQVVRQELPKLLCELVQKPGLPAVQQHKLNQGATGRILCREFVPTAMPGLFVSVGCQEMMPAKSEPLCREAAICTGLHASLMIADRSHHWWLQSPCDLVIFCMWPENFLKSEIQK